MSSSTTGGFNWSAATFGRIKSAVANVKIAELDLDRELDRVGSAVVSAHQASLTAAKLIPIAKQQVTSAEEPRFFGLRSGAESTALPEAANVSPAPDNKRRLIRAAKSHPAGAAQNPLAGDGERRP